MMEPEICTSYEYNDLTNEGKLGERETYSRRETNSNSTTKANSRLSSLNVSTSMSSAMSAFSSIVPAVLSILVATALFVTFTLSVPLVSVSDWNVRDRTIAFSFSAADSTNPYLISLTFANSDETIQSIETTGASQKISFLFLQPETAYEVQIQNDYGIGLQTIKKYHIKTAGVPAYREGSLRVDSYQFNDARDELTLTLALDDPGTYLSAYHIVLTNGDQQIDCWDYDGVHPLVIPLHDFERGYITVSIYAKSSYPTDQNSIIKTAIYKIQY